MRVSTLFPMLLVAGVAKAQFGERGLLQARQQRGGQNQGQNGQNNNNNNNNNGGGGGNANLALDPANVQSNSAATGLEAGAEPGQAASDTDNANFINFCTGKTLTNGLQNRDGSCNGIPMGEIPAANRMVSAVFTSPQNGDVVQPNTAMKFSVQVANLQAGTFTNPDNTYYAAPQALQGGQVVGHTHITVQDLGGNANPTQPLDAETFAFFKGINDNGNGQGLLSADLADGLPEGFYRACSMTSSSNHQPVLMPVAQRGAQDDCVRFQVSANGGGGGNNNGGNNNAGQNNANQGKNQQQQQQGQQGQQQAQQGQQQGQQGQQQGQQGQQQGQQGGGGRGGGRGRGRFGRPKFAARDFIA
ncbi:hypothetical protein EJ07DRAFT_110185 [Lizonia empirigonia]|nr:hypothetical protein EJ07DRAFT_110185 [Lizonia empirigonia]